MRKIYQQAENPPPTFLPEIESSSGKVHRLKHFRPIE